MHTHVLLDLVLWKSVVVFQELWKEHHVSFEGEDIHDSANDRSSIDLRLYDIGVRFYKI